MFFPPEKFSCSAADTPEKRGKPPFYPSSIASQNKPMKKNLGQSPIFHKKGESSCQDSPNE